MLRAVGFHHYVVKPFIHFHLACFRLRGLWFIALPFVGFPLLHLVFLSCFFHILVHTVITLAILGEAQVTRLQPTNRSLT